MKTISAGMSSHLAQEVTTICTCWKIVRTDGTVFGFTDHDVDLVFGGITYESETGYNRTAIRSDSSMGVDNLDVTGFLESDRISDNDLRNGLFDFAKVFIFAVNWADLTQNEIKLRRGWFGEVILNQNGMFETEIRGLHQALAFGFMESYQPECRADFCDTRCGLTYATYVRPAYVYDWLSPSQFIVSDGYPVGLDLSVGAHRYWRLFILQKGPNSNYDGASFAEIRYFDQDNAEVLGGTNSSSSNFSGFTAAGGRDNNPATAWASATGGGINGWHKVDFGTPKDLAKFQMQARNGTSFVQTPVQFKLQYSDDNVIWTDGATYTTPEWLTVSETRTFVGFSGHTYTDVPAPAAGAITYIGGTIKFVTGENAGNTIEIIGYDDATGLVTMFEAFPYPVTIGDTLELTQGCDKIFETCQLYANAENFRGEPHVPGQDEYMKYASTGE